ncbi:DUF4349 domain-containing protein [Pontibacillus sp. HMF3514]|uniref:DUF4349 domain-containing protein n=1 Tax=Pontibacillus sp. HMF3514 TaxID=2692425 RepID=UPI00131FB3C2|nr:DUF4349 domain-containing protein [Pontibacillus sp. HMF3514]QHE51421.1 DUF4349 domain-containing protein [Pontibacillus sp. HMF3514]
MKKIIIGSMCLLLLLLAACSNDQSNEDAASDGSAEGESASTKDSEMNKEESKQSEGNQSYDSVTNGSEESDVNLTNQKEKMMIYKANISIETKDYEQYNVELRKLIQKHNGYMVSSSTRKGENDQTTATIKLRVPQQQFDPFKNGLKPLNGEIVSSNTDGQDVTKEYVDLKSRLAAKKKVEERLLTFLEKADNTDNLLAVSKDLERVQEEIEVIQGKMNYLKNQSDFSTITLHIQETKVIIPKAEKEELQTWAKTKQTFINSVQNMQKFFSFLFIGIVGYSPVLVLFVLAGVLIFFVRRYVRKRHQEE